MEHDSKDKKVHKHHHYILPDKLAILVASALLFLTVVTVWTGGIDLGPLNFPLAMLIATTKALLVCMIFMNLKNDARENSVIFFTSFLFLAIFIVLTGSDIFFRGDVYVKGPLTGPATASKFKKPWVSTPELVKHGQEQFTAQCVSCHGAQGKGDGVAAGALIPKPRNFTADAGWKNGRKPSQIFKTLKEGIPGSAMASFATLPQDDRWALAHYVTTLGPNVLKDAKEDLAKIGIDPAKDTGGAAEAPTIPVQVAMARMTEPDPGASQPVARGGTVDLSRAGAREYQEHCASCHGSQGRGGVVRNLGVAPRAFVRTRPFTGGSSLQSSEQFSEIVTRGLPGDLMPGNGQLSGSQLRDLHQYVRSLATR